jgi:hypothetical protein
MYLRRNGVFVGFFLIRFPTDLNREGRTQRDQRQIDFAIRTSSEGSEIRVWVLCASDTDFVRTKIQNHAFAGDRRDQRFHIRLRCNAVNFLEQL